MIDPSKIPTNSEQIAQHRDNPSLVRKYVKELPDGYSLFYFCSVVLRYDDLDPYVHGSLCYFLEHPKYGRHRDAVVPRSFFKTSVSSVGKNLWLPIRRDPNIRILIAMNTADNAEKTINEIRWNWQNNTLLQQAFPELVPDFRKVRWSNSCCELNRKKTGREGTYEAIGSGGAVVSRHYDHIDEDDLVYAKKDDLSGSEIAPNQDDIDKAIGWHKLVYSLFSDPNKSTIDNIGTRWAPHDLKDWIWRNERRKFQFFRLKAEKDNEPNPDWDGHGQPVWPSRFGTEALRDIYDSQGAYMYATQYLNMPRDPSDVVFQEQWLRKYSSDSEIPSDLTTTTIVDLAGWGDSKGKARNVVLTMSMDRNHNIWVRRIDRGKFSPTEVINLMESHARSFPETTVRPEEVQYQRAVRHFAKKRMKETGFFYRLEPLPCDNRRNAKDLRIRGIEPLAQNGGVHVRSDMYALVNEWNDYPNGMTCDILDCLAWGVVILKPKHVKEAKPLRHAFQLDTILDELESKKHNSGLDFDVQLSNKNNYGSVYH